MKKLLVGLLALSALSSFAQNLNVSKGEVRMFSFAGDENVYITGAAATYIYDGLKVEEQITENKCQLSINGELVDVQVKLKYGKSVTCQKWPTNCIAHGAVNCQAIIELGDGSFRVNN